LDYLKSLTPEELEHEVLPPFWKAGRPPIKVWQPLIQSAITAPTTAPKTFAMIYSLGGPTVGQDYPNYHFAARSPRE
jgi:hypothetical protein